MQTMTIDGKPVAAVREFDVNTHADLLPTIPFGGSKWSGLGQENGTAGLLAFTEPQVVHVKKAGK
jgi:acyl-CoA reductase-like NAD-dependent aldehyde dehydrogenase